MRNKHLEKTIDILELDSNINTFLKENNIFFIKDIWALKRKDLKEMGIKDNDINNIVIKLQLYGLDINKKIYSKD